MDNIRIYIAGPMNPRNGGGAIEYLNNCNRMISVARQLIKLGFAPFCPAVDMLYFLNGESEEEITSSEIKSYSMAWIPACGAMLMMPGWRKSPGARAEFEFAFPLNMPVFFSIDSLAEHFKIKNRE